MTSYLPLAQSIDFQSSPFDNAYQSSGNIRESVTRVVNSTCFKENLQSPQFGSSTQVHLPQNRLLNNVILTCRLKANRYDDVSTSPAVPRYVEAGMPCNVYLPEGWLFSAIDWIEYSYSTSTTLRVPGKHVLINNLAECESGEKRKAMMRLAGPRYDGVWDAANGSNNFFVSGGTYVHIVGSINIPLPHSNMNSGKNIPYDASVVGTKPISIRIQFKPAIDFFTHALASDSEVRSQITLMGNSWEEAYISVKSGYLADGPSESIAGLVSRGGGSKYDYAFIYPGWYESEEFLGTDKGGECRVQLNGILPGSLQSIDIFVQRITYDGDITKRFTKVKHNELKFEEIKNVEITYGGQCIYRSDDNLNQLLTLVEYPVTGSYTSDDIRYNSAGTDLLEATENASISYWLHVQLAQFNEQFMHLIQTGVSLNSNNVIIRFNTPSLGDLTADGPSPGGTSPAVVVGSQPLYKLYCNFNYQCSLRTADGETSILFLKPSRLMPSV